MYVLIFVDNNEQCTDVLAISTSVPTLKKHVAKQDHGDLTVTWSSSKVDNKWIGELTSEDDEDESNYYFIQKVEQI